MHRNVEGVHHVADKVVQDLTIELEPVTPSASGTTVPNIDDNSRAITKTLASQFAWR